MIYSSDIHQERAFFYAPLSFMHRYKAEIRGHFLRELNTGIQNNTIQIKGSQARVMVKYLEWDSAYLNCPTYRLEFFDWGEDVLDPVAALAHTLNDLKNDLSNRQGPYYLFTEIPSEDIVVLQALGLAGLKLIETRQGYFREDLDTFQWPHRSAVREANLGDIPNLRKVAMESRNAFDRLHADFSFPDSVADDYLGTFVENSVKGFADIVLVPDEETDQDQQKPGAFFTANIVAANKSPLGMKLGNIVLVAVGPERRGWHLRLMAEMSYYFQSCGVQISHMTTQSTNRAVIRNCEKLGYKYGKSTHIFATHG
jgi:dTDP-4-amino-4,6-dideoxy-D-galactose acyltransferase